MTTRKRTLCPTIWGLLLTVGLMLPESALALRNMAADSGRVQSGLEQALRGPAAEQAGLEGQGEEEEQGPRIIRFPGTSVRRGGRRGGEISEEDLRAAWRRLTQRIDHKKVTLLDSQGRVTEAVPSLQNLADEPWVEPRAVMDRLGEIRQSAGRDTYLLLRDELEDAMGIGESLLQRAIDSYNRFRKTGGYYYGPYRISYSATELEQAYGAATQAFAAEPQDPNRALMLAYEVMRDGGVISREFEERLLELNTLLGFLGYPPLPTPFDFSFEPRAGLEGQGEGERPVWYHRKIDYEVTPILLPFEDRPRFFYQVSRGDRSTPIFIPLADFAWDYGFRLLGNDQISILPWETPRALGYIRLSVPGNFGDEVLVQVFDTQRGKAPTLTRLLVAGEKPAKIKIGRYQLRRAARKTPEGTPVEGVEIVYEHPRAFYLERIPDELHLSVAQQSRFGELTETLWRATEGSQSISHLMDPQRPWHYRGPGVVIERRRALPQPEGQAAHWVLQATVAGQQWNPEQLAEVVGRQLGPGERAQELPIKFMDGTRIVWTSFFYAQEGGALTLVTRPEPLEGLPHTRRVLVRLLAKLTEPGRPPLYRPSDSLDLLKGTILENTQAPTAPWDGQAFRKRWEATWALTHHPDVDAVRFLLTRLQQGGDFWEPSAPLRMMIVTELVYRHEQGELPLQDAIRLEVWHAFAGLGTGQSTGFVPQVYPLDPVEVVRYVAVQGMARLTPDKRKRAEDEHPFLQKAIEITGEARNDPGLSPLVREILEDVHVALERQRRLGPGRKWPVLPGAPLEDYPSSQAGLEGRDAVAALRAYLAQPDRSRARGVVLVAAEALKGSADVGIPPLAPLLVEAAPFLGTDRLSVVVYTGGDVALAERLWNLGYMAGADIEAVRNWLPDEGVRGFYGTQSDLEEFPQFKGAVTLTAENFRLLFSELLSRLGYPRPAPAEIETFMDALSWRWAA